jgi:2-desacetyl-2-hydroxyethyl bacteriochlorophyllide A dehydrogenase
MQIQEIVITGQNQVELQHSTLDTTLGRDDLLIETDCTFISAGTELANYTGRESKVFLPNQWCSYPWKPGYANVGIVLASGTNVTRAKVGDRVFTFGPHASAFKYPQSRLVAPVPARLDSAVAVASRMAGVATTALILSEVRGSPWVAVFGLGTVGNLAAQSFRIRGCRVIGIDPAPRQRALATECGIEHVLAGDAERQIKELTDGKGADITVDAVGHSTVVQQAVRVTADYGQIVLLGSPRVPVTDDLTPLLMDIHYRYLTMRGALEWCLPDYPVPGGRMSFLSKQQMIFDWIERGEMRIEPLISHRLPPAQIKDAYEGLEYDREHYTGVVLVWK